MPVTVRPSFLLIAALIGFTGVLRIEETLAWVAIVFVSILIHELGHALTARSYGADVAIELNGLGGLTRWGLPEGELTPGRRALIAAAGSATGLLFGGVVWLIGTQLGRTTGLTSFILDNTVRVNVFWGLLNWLPIRPLDGGHLVQSLLEKVAPARASLIARALFMTTAGVALAVAIVWGRALLVVLAAWLLLSELTITARPAQPGLPTLSYDDPPPGEDFAPPEPDVEPEEPDDRSG
ncbi:MAG: site-2 protease family protein [Acidimicrobiia bacterium]